MVVGLSKIETNYKYIIYLYFYLSSLFMYFYYIGYKYDIGFLCFSKYMASQWHHSSFEYKPLLYAGCNC